MRRRPRRQAGPTGTRFEHDGEGVLLDRCSRSLVKEQIGRVAGWPAAEVSGQDVGHGCGEGHGAVRRRRLGRRDSSVRMTPSKSADQLVRVSRAFVEPKDEVPCLCQGFRSTLSL